MSYKYEDFDLYQADASEFAEYPQIGSNLIYPALGLTGEAGEVAEKVKKLWRNHNLELTQERTDAIAAEMGDVLWYLAALAEELGILLSDVAEYNVGKLRDRQIRGVIKSEGDDR